MVRNKQPPQQLNDVEQRQANWNMLDGGGPAQPPQPLQRPQPPGGEAGPRQDDDIVVLLNDLSDDDDDDIDFIPGGLNDPVLRPRRVHWGGYVEPQEEESDDEVVVLPQPAAERLQPPQQQELDYGSFRGVLDNAQFYVKVWKGGETCSPREIKERDKHIFCYLGNISFTLKDPTTLEEVRQIPCSEFWVYVSLEADQSAIYFEWMSNASPKKSRQKKKVADNFQYLMIDGVLYADLWQGLSTQCHFELRLDTFDNVKNEMSLKVYLKTGGLCDLKHPSDTFQYSESMGTVVSYFFGVDMVVYKGEKTLKHDLDELYSAIKEWHAGREYCQVDAQHPSLFPQLRPYQKAAVQWMLYQERFGQEDKVRDTKDLHCLFVELQTKDGITLYFNKFAGFLVKDKPLAVLPTPGGILADEMGLGKTVEVLSCMLCHPRMNVPQPEYLEPISVETHKTKRKRKSIKRLNGQDIFTLDCEVAEEGEEEEDSESHTEDSLNESISTDSGISGVSRQTQNRSERRAGKKKVLPLKKAQEDPDVPLGRVKVHLPRQESSDTGELTRSGRPRRNASKPRSTYEGYMFFDEEGDEEAEDYKPPEKKAKKTLHRTPSVIVEQEIANCTVWSSIESAIVGECWGGKMKDYRKEGSYKEFRKFLRMRKKDPYYMMTLRERVQLQHQTDLAKYSASEVVNRRTIQGFFNTRVEPKSYFECICGSADTEADKFRVQCGVCSLWQHAECVQYDVSDTLRGPYVCPHCWTTSPPVTSGATLIVTPSSISYQWVNEIMKHVKHKSIRMLVYKGVSTQGYMQPHYLAKFDIVITTYETLSRELNYVDLPHSNSQMGRRFRHPKRFMATPSPLPCVEWWRVCLDEAQMVECTTTKTAEMALRLAAVNRWCVTGTPVQKTVNELQGLLMFLGVDPYWVAQWWGRCLYQPYCHGVKEPLHRLLGLYLWRNSKKDVIHQIDIPQQIEEVHWLSFTRVEEHFYQRLHTVCSYDAQQRLNKFPDGRLKLSALDRPTLTSLLHPLLKLRQACNHPQVVKGQFLSINRKTMTMEMLLDNLVKKTKLEAEEAHRLLIASINGLGAVHIMREEWEAAVEMYREALRSIEDHTAIKTDSLQRLHTLHNLAEVLEASHEGIQPTLRDGALREEAEAIRSRYLQQYPQQVATTRLECLGNTEAVVTLQGSYNMGAKWWLGALQSFDDDFVLEVRDEMLSNYSRFEEHKCLLHPVTTRTHLQLVLNAEMKKLSSQRTDMINGMKHLHTMDHNSMLNGAIDCHLRPTESEPPQCILCATHEFFKDYEETLFSMRELKHSRTTEVSRETQDVKDQAQVIQSTRRGHWGQGETERVLKYLQTKSLEKVEEELYQDSHTHFKELEAMKKEFKNYRIWWRAVFDSVSAMDEVNMATIRLRLRFPDEELPQDRGKKKKEGDDLDRKVEVIRYILDPAELPQQELKLKSDRIVATSDLKVKLGQLLYLQNLAKTDFGKDGGKNPEPCPICQGELGEKWAVLLCGHCYCMECIRTLTNRGFNGLDRSAIKCPMCRQPTKTREVSYVDVKAKEEEEVKVQGSLSTKMEGVVRLMIKIRLADPQAKVLIFSSWVDVLDVIADAFAQNGITYRALHQRSKFHRHLSSFKTSSQITALLLPISSGANGLNIVEARHVILVEPILNPAAELQAIGRVHRIGQTKETTVHRFLVRETIEERMYHILRHHHLSKTSQHTDENNVTIEELRNLFRHPEELELEREVERRSNQGNNGEQDGSGMSNVDQGNSRPSCSGDQGGSSSRGGNWGSGGQSRGDADSSKVSSHNVSGSVDMDSEVSDLGVGISDDIGDLDSDSMNSGAQSSSELLRGKQQQAEDTNLIVNNQTRQHEEHIEDPGGDNLDNGNQSGSELKIGEQQQTEDSSIIINDETRPHTEHMLPEGQYQPPEPLVPILLSDIPPSAPPEEVTPPSTFPQASTSHSVFHPLASASHAL